MALHELIRASLHTCMSYATYRGQIQAYLKSPESATDPMRSYFELNEARMRRLDKTLQPHPNLNWPKLPFKPIALTLSEGWCGDAAQQIPILAFLEQYTQAFQLQIIARDQHLELMDHFLTDGNRAIPVVLWIHPEYLDVIGVYGPRPKPLQDWVKSYKALHGQIDEAARAKIHQWYTKDKGMQIQASLRNCLAEGTVKY